MLSYYERSDNGHDYERELIQEFERIGCRAELTGSERLYPKIAHDLRFNEDETAHFIRSHPDGIAYTKTLTPYCFYFDAKAGATSVSISKMAHDHYKNLSACGCNVFLFFKKYHNAWNSIEKLQLIDGNFTNTAHRFPYDGPWVYPRKHPDWNTIKKTWRGSGTPYAVIQIDSLRPWAEFGDLLRVESATGNICNQGLAS